MAKSDLPLRIVELQHFPYCEAFEDLLKAKGHGLQELLFRAINSLNSKQILFIGQNCKSLQRLHIKELGPEEDQTMALMTPCKQFSTIPTYKDIFPEKSVCPRVPSCPCVPSCLQKVQKILLIKVIRCAF